MLTTFFESWESRYSELRQFLEEEKYNELADSSHQLKGILGNLSLQKGFTIIKSVQEQAKLENAKKLDKLLSALKKELIAAQDYFLANQDLFK